MRVYTKNRNRTELDNVIPSASPKYSFYKPSKIDHMDLKVKLKSSRLQFEVQLLEMQVSLQSHQKDNNEEHDILRKLLASDYAKIIYCIDEMGLLCAYEAVKICIANAKAMKECNSKCLCFLEESLCLIKNSLPNGHENIFDAGCDFEKMVAAGYISPKLHQLFKLLMSFGGAIKVSCIIFVDRMITAKILDIVSKKVVNLSHFHVSYLAGGDATTSDSMLEKMQKECLKSFHSGKVDLLFTTDCVDEGIHMPKCSTVINFDIPKTMSSKSGSQFIILIERGNEKQRELICDILRNEHLMNVKAKKRVADTCVVKPCKFDETESSLTAESSVILIDRYCAKLPADKSYSKKPTFHYLLVKDSYKCVMTLPPNAAFQQVTGPLCKSTSDAKQLVCLEACKKLHQIGALVDNLPIDNENPLENISSEITEETPSGTGTTKRKELHGTVPIRAVSGTWGGKLDHGVDLYAYKVRFTCNVDEIIFSSFVLLLESKLDEDVANIEMELYLVSKFVKCKVSPCGKLHLDETQVAKCKCFHELFFNGIFGKLYVGWKHSKEPRRFLLETDQKLWTPSYMYFLLPLESLDPFKISWKEIDSCASTIEFVKKSSFLSTKKQNLDSTMTDSDSTSMIHFANRSVHKDDVTNVVVLAIHTGKIYSVLELLQDETAYSAFEDSKKFSSFMDYFKKKNEIDLVYPEQNMLLLKHSHRAHNLLVDFNGEGILHGKKIKADRSKVNTEKQTCYAHLPPELLVIVDVRTDVVKSLYLLPSLMHRLESLMLASQLREEIAGHMTDFHISSSLILEAITTLRCNESFSMERLELLGDSVLKYAVTCDLYLQDPKQHEGQLSASRSLQVCNSALYNLGIRCRLQGYIRDIAYDPTRWTPPGQLPLRTYPCDHGVDTIEVPIGAKYHTEEPKIVAAKCCDLGHRWLGSKTISDCVEALVGAYFMDGGLTGALHFMKWLGIRCDLDPSHVSEVIKIASLHTYTPKLELLRSLESKLGYEFEVKGLLLEAITHASNQDNGVGYCYQRLEFLGDSLLDLLITRYLFSKHNDIDQGELTNLRSASVNNENFAYAAVRRNFHSYLQHRSGSLQTQISEYVKFVATSSTDTNSLQTKKSPKALGDMVESIAGAILLDTKLNLDETWRIMELLLSPIVTPEKLELPPLRELLELCNSKGYFIKEACSGKNDCVVAELKLQLEDVLLVAEGSGTTRKAAKAQAALKLLSQLEKKCISSKNVKERDTTQSKVPRFDPQPAAQTSVAANECLIAEASNSKTEIPVLKSINSKKGGPRSSLYELCRKMQWPMPIFTSSEQKSKNLIEIGEGAHKRTAFNSFESQISLTIPNCSVIELAGEPRADKKSSFDSAALLMLHELQRLGKLIIE